MGGEVRDLAIGVTPGRGFLSFLSLQLRPFYLYLTVMRGISSRGDSQSHCFPWLPFDWLSKLNALKCQQFMLNKLYLFANKHSLVPFGDGKSYYWP